VCGSKVKNVSDLGSSADAEKGKDFENKLCRTGFGPAISRFRVVGLMPANNHRFPEYRQGW